MKLHCVLLLWVAAHAMMCKDDHNRPVDYWVALKHHSSANYHIHTPHSELQLSPYTMGTASGALAHTLHGIYGYRNESLNRVMYNDQDDQSKVHQSHAHAKGVLVANTKEGFWLIHSIPRYPIRPSEARGRHYHILPSYTFGQSFLCLSLGVSDIDAVAFMLRINSVGVYDTHHGSSHLSGNLSALIDGTKLQQNSATLPLTTLGGQRAIAFARQRDTKYGELYEDMVAPALKSHLLVETWMNDAHTNVMPSYCPPKFKYQVENVKSLITSDGKFVMKESQDHSKWAITSPDSKKHFVCVGDINRMFSQSARGGGTVCLDNKLLWEGFFSAVATIETCDQAIE